MTTETHTLENICDFCEYSTHATVICETCLLQYCDSCFESHHPMRGTLENHLATRTRADLADERCSLHNEKYLHYCITCRKRVCPHCLILPKENSLISKRHPHLYHEVVTVEQHIDKEKKNLLQQIEKVSHVLETADYGGDTVEDRKLLLEFTWLSYKEKVRQEFVSLHDLLIEREKDLLEKMQKSVDASLTSLTSLEQLQKTFEAEETLLTEENIKLVQDKSRVRFMKGYKNILHRCEELCNSIQLMPRLDDVTPAFLKMPFSLIEEKLHLNDALQFEAYDETSIVPKSRVTFVQSCDLNKPIRCFDLWEAPKNIPASTGCVYNVEVRSKSGSKVIRYTNIPLDDFVFNSVGRVSLLSGKKYVLKVVPVYICSGCGGTQHTLDGTPLCIMVLTGQSSSQNGFEKTKPYHSTRVLAPRSMRDGPAHVHDSLMTEMPEGRFHMKTLYLLHSSFEEERLLRERDEGDEVPTRLMGSDESCSTVPEVGKTMGREKFQLDPRHLENFSFEETHLEDVAARGLQTIAGADVIGSKDGFLLDQSRYQTKECFLSHYSFEENRYDYLQGSSPSLSASTLVTDPSMSRADNFLEYRHGAGDPGQMIKTYVGNNECPVA